MNALSPNLHSYELFASAAKHTMDDHLRFKRRAEAEDDWWLAQYYARLSVRLREAAWSHLEAAREAKERAAQ